MEIPLTPIDVLGRSRAKDRCLKLSNNNIQLVDEEDKHVISWSPKQAVEALKLPSFFANRPDFGILLPGTDSLKSFKLHPEDLEFLRSYLDQQYLRRTPNAAFEALLIGGGIFVVGFVVAGIPGWISYQSYMKAAEEAATNPEGATYVFWKGPIALGCLIMLYGCTQMFEFFKWLRIARQKCVIPAPIVPAEPPMQVREEQVNDQDNVNYDF